MTSQGHPHAIFRRAIGAGNVVVAEIAAHELRGLSLSDALDLTALMALRNRDVAARVALAERELTDLGPLAGKQSDSRAINARGQIVGQSDGHAFLWLRGKMMNLRGRSRDSRSVPRRYPAPPESSMSPAPPSSTASGTRSSS
jgi:probable HAF family extracellular repeat protein